MPLITTDSTPDLLSAHRDSATEVSMLITNAISMVRMDELEAAYADLVMAKSEAERLVASLKNRLLAFKVA